MVWDPTKAVKELKANARSKSAGQCAKYTRIAIEAGGVVLTRHNSAKNYGSSLVAVGFREIEAADYLSGKFLAGDVVILQDVTGHPHGHMAMYDGQYWVSDFVQSSIYPATAYKQHNASYVIYRYQMQSKVKPKAN
jgi:co-chaperonin GroES (HSP10)